jgi:hypothetical protein
MCSASLASLYKDLWNANILCLVNKVVNHTVTLACQDVVFSCVCLMFVSVITYFLFCVAASRSEVWCTEITLYFKLCFKYLVGTVILKVCEYKKMIAHNMSDIKDIKLKMRPQEGGTESYLMSY